MHTCHAWLESEDRSGAETGLAAVTDDLIITSGDNIRLRKDMPLIALAYVWSNSNTYFPTAARLAAPTLGSNHLRLSKGIGLYYTSAGLVYDWRNRPFSKIRAGDNVTGYGYEVDEAGTAHYLGIIVIVSDGSIDVGPCPKPLTHVHNCTATATTAGSWTQLALTETDALPAGEYEMFGARVEHAGAAAARFVFKGIEARPAVVPVTRTLEDVHPFSAYWGRPYKFKMPDGLPDIEILETAGSGTVECELYLTKTG